MPPEQKLEFDI
jgi:hypothetical protein